MSGEPLDLGAIAAAIADEHAPTALALHGVTLVIIACTADGYGIALRGVLDDARLALPCAEAEVASGEGFVPMPQIGVA